MEAEYPNPMRPVTWATDEPKPDSSGVLPDAAALGKIYDTARAASQYRGLESARRNAHIDATEARIRAINEATGEDVPNPYNGGYLEEAADKILDSEWGRMFPILTPVLKFYPWAVSNRPWAQEPQLDAFQKRLDELALKYPDKADIIGADRPITEDAKALRHKSDIAESKAFEATSGLSRWVASFAGGTVGSLRDPLMAGSLFVSAPLGAAKTVLGKIALEAGRQAAENAAITAVSEVTGAQQFERDVGEPAGVGRALGAVGLSGAFGAIPGAGIEAARIGAHRLKAEVVSRIERGDTKLAREVADSIPREMSPELWAAANALHDDAAVRAHARASGLDDEAIDDVVNAAVRHAEDPGEPLPPFDVGPVSEARSPLPALRDVRDVAEAIDSLRGDAQAIAGAVQSGNPALRDLGRIASLDDEALALVRSGAVDPVIASEVAARVREPAEQASIMKAVSEMDPTDRRSIAIMVSQEMERRAAPEANNSMLGADDGKVERTVDAPDVDYAESAARDARIGELEKRLANLEEGVAGAPQGKNLLEVEAKAASRALTAPIEMPAKPKGRGPTSLIMFLKNLGGVQDEGGNLKSAGFVRGHPGLINKSGMPMDKAREAAAEAGYIERGGDVTEFIDAITAHPRYSVHDEMQAGARRLAEEGREEAARELEYKEYVKKALVDLGLAEADLVDPALNAAARLVIREGIDADVAYERAIMHHLSDDPRARADDDGIPWDEWTKPQPRAKASAGREAGTVERGAIGPGGEAQGVRGAGEGAPGARGEAGAPVDRAQGPVDPYERVNMFPAATRADGKDMVLMTKEELLAREPREGFLSNLIVGCPGVE